MQDANLAKLWWLQDYACFAVQRALPLDTWRGGQTSSSFRAIFPLWLPFAVTDITFQLRHLQVCSTKTLCPNSVNEPRRCVHSFGTPNLQTKCYLFATTYLLIEELQSFQKQLDKPRCKSCWFPATSVLPSTVSSTRSPHNLLPLVIGCGLLSRFTVPSSSQTLFPIHIYYLPCVH